MMRRWIVRPARSALAGLFFVAYGLFALPFAVFLPLPFVTPRFGRAAVRLMYKLFVATARVTGLYTVSVSAADRGRLSSMKGCVIAANHVSLIDICVLMAHLPDSVCIAKSAARRNPFLSAVVRKLFIANDLGAEAALAQARQFLESGVNVVVFPQGTRGGGSLHRGAARIALSAGRAVECVRLGYDPVVLAKGQPWHDVGGRIIRIALEVRGAVQPAGADTRASALAMTAEIARLLGVARA